MAECQQNRERRVAAGKRRKATLSPANLNNLHSVQGKRYAVASHGEHARWVGRRHCEREMVPGGGIQL